MRNLMSLFLFMILAVRLVGAGQLSEAETKEIKNDISFMMTQFNKGNVQVLLDYMHEPIFAAVGVNKEVYSKILKQAAEQMAKMAKIDEFSVGTPTELYPAGKYELCIVPTVMIAEIQGKKLKITSCMIAVRVRTTGQPGWKYLDQSGFDKNPKLLKILFPDLDSKVTLPPFKTELL